jgi:hypothetical protein
MDEHELRPGGRGRLEQLAVGGDAGRHCLDFLASWYLKPVRSVVCEGGGLEQVVEEGKDVTQAGHRRTS